MSDSTDDSTSRLSGIKYNVHSCIQHLPVEQLKASSTKLSLPVHLMLFNLDGNMNVAMSIRSAAVLGCSDVWIVGRRKYDARPEVGAKNYIRVHKVDTVDPEFFIANSLQPFMIEQGGTPLEEMNFKPCIRGPTIPCFIMGSEGHGLSEEFMKSMKPTAQTLTISQYGLVRSLNVSIAASIVIYEYLKQMRAASAV
jgi:tRNA G18 (ribose-2'-O)-methylase SpoU